MGHPLHHPRANNHHRRTQKMNEQPLTVNEVLKQYGEEFVKLGYGRRQIEAWLNDNLPGTYTEYFARKVTDSLKPPNTQKIQPAPTTPNEPQEPTDIITVLRNKYGITDPTWVPIKIWGTSDDPQASWKRDLRGLDTKTILNAMQTPLMELPTSEQSTEYRMGVISIRDTHFGMFTDHPQPYATYDLKEAQNAYMQAARTLATKAKENGVKHIVLPVGSDAIHVDGPSNATTKGTQQDTSSPWYAAFETYLSSVNSVIKELTEAFEKITVVVEPGNHDHTLAQALGAAIKTFWSEKVTVLAGQETLKRVSVGKTHVFMHHGQNMKPGSYHATILADYPEVTDPNYIEVLTGHYHHRARYVVGDYKEDSGIVCRITPALCPSSNWSESQGYRSLPGAQLTIYDNEGFQSLHEWRPKRQK
jgi:hypothetical protein